MDIFSIFGRIVTDNSKANKDIDETTKKAGDSQSKLSKYFDKIGESAKKAFQNDGVEKFGSSLDDLTENVKNQQSKLDALKEKYKDLYLTHGKNSEEARACAKEIEELSKELKENKDRLQEAEKSANEFDQSLENVADESERTEGKLSSTLKKIGAAVIAAFSITAIISFGTSLVNLAATAESSFAKVSTLLDTATTDMTAYFDDIKQASSETGVAFDKFSEAVYQAISASVDQEEAVAFTTQAVHLAKGGFTETATAVDILTTAMNAYGPAAGTAAEISDKLITTQNLGKTTVDELANNMGRVIPTANMYGVSIDTVCSAYAEMTKNGIATAESTTYLNSMINELGASGTTASNAIKDALGMSFKEAMEAGYSLTDVLAILQEKADATGVSMGDMFGSQEAAKAAATLQQNANDFDAIMQRMASSAGATEEAYEKVTNTFEARSEKLKTQFQNIGISIGNTVLPVLIKITDMIDDKMPEIEEAIGAISPLLESVFDAFLPIFQVLGELFSVGIQIISVVLPSLFQVLQPLLNLLSPILDLLQPIMSIIESLMGPLTSLLVMQLEPVVELVAYLLESILPVLQSSLEWLSDFIATYLNPAIQFGLDSNMGAISNFVGQLKVLIDGVVLFISGTLDVIMGIANVFIALFNGDFESAGEALMQILTGLGNMIGGLLQAAFFNFIYLITNNLDQIRQFFSNWGTNISNFFSNLWQSSIDTAKLKVEFLKNTITNILQSAADMIHGIVERIRGFFNFEFQIPGIKMPHFTITPSGWNMSKLLQGEIPKLGVEWYAKAMDDGMIMDQPTIFGINGNRLMGGGEAGSETVVGTQSLMEMIQGAVDSRIGSSLSELTDLVLQIVNLMLSGSGDIILPIYLGTELIDERIIKAQELQALRTGGR